MIDLATLATLHDNVALVQFQSYQSVNGPLAGWDRTSNELSLGCEEVTVVEDSTELDGGELVSQSSDIPVQGKALNINMSDSQDGCARRFVTSSGFDTNESILDDIDSTDTMFPAQSIESQEDLYSISVLLCLVRYHNFDGKTTFEFNSDALGSLWGIFRSSSEFPHIRRRGGIGILKDTSLVRDMEKVLVS